jgi:hypothetical protein
MSNLYLKTSHGNISPITQIIYALKLIFIATVMAESKYEIDYDLPSKFHETPDEKNSLESKYVVIYRFTALGAEEYRTHFSVRIAIKPPPDSLNAGQCDVYLKIWRKSGAVDTINKTMSSEVTKKLLIDIYCSEVFSLITKPRSRKADDGASYLDMERKSDYTYYFDREIGGNHTLVKRIGGTSNPADFASKAFEAIAENLFEDLKNKSSR